MTNKNRLFIDLHVLQTLPPSCVNRDDTGSPKTAMYGGVTRARVSSQAWKKAMRDDFRLSLPDEDVGKRTKKVVALLAEEITKRAEVKDAEKLASAILLSAGVKTSEKKGVYETGALFFISHAQINALAEIAAKYPEGKLPKESKAECQAALKSAPAYDIAFFGRMVADDPSLNFDAASQVAHAISTHAVQNEYDYFTAVDDCAPEDNAGAGHLGTVEYNASTMYRYATLNVEELTKALGGETADAVRVFIEAFIRSMPTGKQNTFANRTRPDAVYAVVRQDQPVNMAGAFEQPIPAGREGYVSASIQRLKDYAQESYASFVDEPSLALSVGAGLADLATPTTVQGLAQTIAQWVAEHAPQVAAQ